MHFSSKERIEFSFALSGHEPAERRHVVRRVGLHEPAAAATDELHERGRSVQYVQGLQGTHLQHMVSTHSETSKRPAFV